jgi:hypothetical protein
MEPAVKSSLLWGVVGALSFLVLGQGYQLIAGGLAGLELMAGAAIVGVVTAAVAHVMRPRLRERYG